jgi:N-acyl-D-aspartate/D-glutamate deacylase
VLDEIVLGRASTYDACDEFQARFPRHAAGIVVYADATGARLQTSGTTDVAILRKALKEKHLQDALQPYRQKWGTTLGEYLTHLEKRGVSTNVASFVGATTVRIHEIGYADRPPTPDELDRMKALVRQAMQEGAVGVCVGQRRGSSWSALRCGSRSIARGSG